MGYHHQHHRLAGILIGGAVIALIHEEGEAADRPESEFLLHESGGDLGHDGGDHNMYSAIHPLVRNVLLELSLKVARVCMGSM